jgi:hypothetical protein
VPTELTVTRSWPWGLAFVADALAADLIPESLGDVLVVGMPSTLICAVMHESQGTSTVAVVIDGAAPLRLVPEFDGVLDLPSGAITVSDAQRADVRTAVVAPGRYRALVVSNEVREPTLVQVWLNRQDA